MCIVFMSISDNPTQDGYKVIIAVNRDEFYNRPTKDLHWWDNEPDIISGNAISGVHLVQFVQTI